MNTGYTIVSIEQTSKTPLYFILMHSGEIDLDYLEKPEIRLKVFNATLHIMSISGCVSDSVITNACLIRDPAARNALESIINRATPEVRRSFIFHV